MERFKEWLAVEIALALPKRIAYWASIRVAAHATTGEYGHQIVPELTLPDMLRRWETA